MRRFIKRSSGKKLLTDTCQNKKKRKRIWLVCLCMFFLLIGFAAGGIAIGYQAWQDMYKPLPEGPIPADGSLDSTPSEVTFEGEEPPAMNLISPVSLPVEYKKEYANILLIISEEEKRADLMLLTIDQLHEQIKLTFFPRELWVRIPETERDDRLDVAYSCGGPKLAVQTLEQNFGIGIDRYIEIDFQQFPALINQLGGIELTLSEAEADYINQHTDCPEKLEGAGTYNLSGQQAFCHAQNRTAQVHDFDSVDRMRDVILATLQRVQTTNDMVCLGKLAVDSTSMISTDIQLDELGKLLIGCLDYSQYEFFLYCLPNGEDYEKNAALSEEGRKEIFCIQDMEQVRKQLQNFIYGDFDQSDIPENENLLYNTSCYFYKFIA